MRKTVNTAIDAASFAAFAAMSATGLVLRYMLPPGSGGPEHGHGPVVMLWGFTRHQWGGAHFWLAAAFFALLALHLVLHWQWLVHLFRGGRTEASGWRAGLGLVGLAAVLLLAAAPFLSPKRTVMRVDLGVEEVEVRGSMTLEETAAAAGMEVRGLLRLIGLPEDTDPGETLGRLRRSHGLDVQEVRRLVRESRRR